MVCINILFSHITDGKKCHSGKKSQNLYSKNSKFFLEVLNYFLYYICKNFLVRWKLKIFIPPVVTALSFFLLTISKRSRNTKNILLFIYRMLVHIIIIMLTYIELWICSSFMDYNFIMLTFTICVWYANEGDITGPKWWPKSIYNSVTVTVLPNDEADSSLL